MGYVTKDIAIITEPKRVTLSGLPNFVQFAGKPAGKTYLEVNLTVVATQTTATNTTLLRLTPLGETAKELVGTTDGSKVNSSTFYLSADPSDTAENIRTSLLSDTWVRANFEISIPTVWKDGKPRNGTTLNIKSKGAGADYSMTLEAPNDPTNAAYSFGWITRTSRNNDSISGEASIAEIELDVYTDPDVFLGADDKPIDAGRIGRHLATLSKTYAGDPLWYDLNGIFAQYGGYNTPRDTTGWWFDTGTCRVCRFTAKIAEVNSYPFYQSNALYILNGYGKNADENDLTAYVYDGAAIKLLTNKPRTPYVRGQKEYLNFIFSDPQRGAAASNEFTLRICYIAYSAGDKYLGKLYGPEKRHTDFAIVNTCRLSLDAVLDAYPTAGVVRVALARGEDLVSNDLEYTVRPDCLHTLRQFTFLNRLGGWDAFNFDAPVKDDIKPTVETYNKTVTPSYRRGDSVETVYNVNVANTRTVEGAPVSDEVAEWLKELAASRVVLDEEGNYVIIEDFTLQVSASNKNMHRPTIKYRLSK